jgi:hypothetical protein
MTAHSQICEGSDFTFGFRVKVVQQTEDESEFIDGQDFSSCVSGKVRVVESNEINQVLAEELLEDVGPLVRWPVMAKKRSILSASDMKTLRWC